MLTPQQIATLLDPSNLVVDMGFAMSWAVFYFAVLAWVLPIPHKRLYFVLTLTSSATMMFFKPIVPQHIFMCIDSIAICVIPLLMSKGPLFPRFAAVVLSNIALIPAELVGVLIFTSITGLGVVDNAKLLELWYIYLPSFLLGDFLTFFLIMAAVKKLIHKTFFKNDPREAAAGISPDATNRSWLWRYVWFLLLQIALASVLFFIALFVEHGSVAFNIPVGLCILLCVAVDAALFAQIERSLDQAKRAEQIKQLERDVNLYMGMAAQRQQLLADTARLRHDLRNHRLVVDRLCQMGRFDQAQAYLEELDTRPYDSSI